MGYPWQFIYRQMQTARQSDRLANCKCARRIGIGPRCFKTALYSNLTGPCTQRSRWLAGSLGGRLFSVRFNVPVPFPPNTPGIFSSHRCVGAWSPVACLQRLRAGAGGGGGLRDGSRQRAGVDGTVVGAHEAAGLVLEGALRGLGLEVRFLMKIHADLNEDSHEMSLLCPMSSLSIVPGVHDHLARTEATPGPAGKLRTHKEQSRQQRTQQCHHRALTRHHACIKHQASSLIAPITLWL